MPKSPDTRGLDIFTLSDRSLYRLLDSQQDDWQELPAETKLPQLKQVPSHKRLSSLRRKLRSLLSKRRRHAYQST